MTVTVQDLKNSLRIDHPLDDSLLDAYLKTATSFVVSAVDSTKTVAAYAADPRFDFAVSLLAQHWYANRGVDGAAYVPDSVVSMIQQLRGANNGDRE
ncbi:head-tail connector protein [Schleiferilactobacillus perolens]|uniref:head-tail connector protein n=1 Tax=Schleiferilactobacillus perolens TaxID=100468 RepID=UPI0023565209|nr:head-tail connector protein [Schleiferilactobacillus perolens]MCI2170976.1 head-tail connector protein [Schleiferilactobacillus perolens]